MLVILIGVSGSGKSTIGNLLGDNLGWAFFDGDEFHPQENVQKMRNGIALTDDDREPWLDSLRALASELISARRPGILACSALKKSYREHLRGVDEGVKFVYLRGDYDLIRQRLASWQGHFMPAGLLEGQCDILEEPECAITIDAAPWPEEIVQSIKNALGL